MNLMDERITANDMKCIKMREQQTTVVAGHCQFTVWFRLPFWETLERLYL